MTWWELRRRLPGQAPLLTLAASSECGTIAALLVVLFLPSFVATSAAQSVNAIAAAMMPPAVAAITLGLNVAGARAHCIADHRSYRARARPGAGRYRCRHARRCGTGIGRAHPRRYRSCECRSWRRHDDARHWRILERNGRAGWPPSIWVTRLRSWCWLGSRCWRCALGWLVPAGACGDAPASAQTSQLRP